MPAPDIEAPPLELIAGANRTLTPRADQPSPCPAGLVPQPVEQRVPKLRPDAEQMSRRSAVPAADRYFIHAGGLQLATALGAGANIAVGTPYLGWSDYHSLIEMSLHAQNWGHIIEVGWHVDPNVAPGASRAPHLFVYHWVNGKETCYNGCGWVQWSPSVRPGTPITTPGGQWNSYDVAQWGGNWWIAFDGQWMGYFPGSLWSGQFNQAEKIQWFGEVNANKSWPCTRMGNGLWGSDSNSTTVMDAYYTISNSYHPAIIDYYSEEPALYEVYQRGAWNSFSVGGPGAGWGQHPCDDASRCWWTTDECGEPLYCEC